jgi:enamine deaminase RidA (YjgF/YER057c/UK114 family)
MDRPWIARRPVSAQWPEETARMLRHLTPETIRAPFARYHHAVEVTRAERLLFVSGQLGVAADGCVPESVEEQTRLAFANIDACLAAAGMDRQHVVRLTTYLTEAAYRPAFMAVRDAWVGEPVPASTLVVVMALAQPACKVEIEVVAAA